MLDFLAASPNMAADLFPTTSSSNGVHEIIQLSMAPAFLLAGIGALMNVMMARLIWLTNRIESIAAPVEGACLVTHQLELAWLRKRQFLARRAIKFSTGAAAVISLVIAVLFVSAFIETPIGLIVVVLWVTTIGLLITGLSYLLRETLVAADQPSAPGT